MKCNVRLLMFALAALVILVVLLMAVAAMIAVPATAATHECGISERVVLENTTDASVTYSFSRGAHDGFVTLLPGQSVTVDVVWCK